jgi:hypothetical protein
MTRIEGGCHCGQVRYRAAAEPVFIGLCHCTDCQKFSGSAFATVLGVPTASLDLTGSLKTFTKPGDSGRPMHRRFCPDCGSGVIEEAEALPGVAMIAVGSLDDCSWVKPASAIYCDSAQSWVELGGTIERFAKAPR